MRWPLGEVLRGVENPLTCHAGFIVSLEEKLKKKKASMIAAMNR